MAATSVTATAACVSVRGNYPDATAMLIYNLILITSVNFNFYTYVSILFLHLSCNYYILAYPEVKRPR